MESRALERELVSRFYRGNGLNLGIAAVAALAGGTLNIAVSWLMQQLIDTASGVSGAYPLEELAFLTGVFVLVCFASFMLKYASEPRFIEKALRQYKDFAFKKLTEKNISSFKDESTAAYLSAMTNDVGSIEADYLGRQLELITKTTAFFGSLALMLCYSPTLTLVAAAVTALPLAASLLTGSRLTATERRVSDRSADFTAALSDCLGGFTVVKTFKAEKEIFALFAENNRSLEHEKFGRRRLRVLVGMFGAVTGITAQLTVFLVGAYLALSGKGITAGTVIMFVNLMNMLIDPVAELPAILGSRKAAKGLIAKLAAALREGESLGGEVHHERLEEGICLEDVRFSYDGENEVLHGVTAKLRAGGSYAVVGASGSGKSTLLKLLTAENSGYSGHIRLDGTELSKLAPESLYEMMSVIQQNVFVFNASITDNITMFRSFPEDELRSALRCAHLDELIAKRGGDCLCGENGKELSGGEKQRISIARSLLKRSSVLLADEATAALDAQTAHRVTSDILDLDGITRIVVTHSLEESLLRRFDGIVVMRDGRIEELGSFTELMEKRGYFRALYTVSE